MVLVFYYHLLSQPSRSVFMLLKHAGIDFEAKIVDLAAGESRKPAFKKENPLSTVPFIKDGGFKLAETGAIMRYITTKYDVKDSLYPRADPEKQAICDQFLHWHHTGLRKQCVEVFIILIKGNMPIGFFTAQPVDEKRLSDGKDAIKRSVEVLDTFFLKGKPFICGDEVSVADIVAINELVQLDIVGEEGLYMGNANVAKWVNRVKAAIDTTFDEASKERMGMAEMYKKTTAGKK